MIGPNLGVALNSVENDLLTHKAIAELAGSRINADAFVFVITDRTLDVSLSYVYTRKDYQSVRPINPLYGCSLTKI